MQPSTLDALGNDEECIQDSEMLDADCQRTSTYALQMYISGKLLCSLEKFKDSQTQCSNEGTTEKAQRVRVWIGILQAATNGVNDGRRLYHNIFGIKLPTTIPNPLTALPNHEIMVLDGVLSPQFCDEAISLFEAAPHQLGPITRHGKMQLDFTIKKASEFLVRDGVAGAAAADTGSAAGAADANRTRALWTRVDRVLLGALVKHLQMYEDHNPGVRLLRNPLGDEGFRIKRYDPPPEAAADAGRPGGRPGVGVGGGHHAFHSDGGDEGAGPRRVLAWVVYLNTVGRGGETVFLAQGERVSPRCGRAVMFPAAFTHVHAGAPPESGVKYDAVNFVTVPL